jgi:hypothetical protein
MFNHLLFQKKSQFQSVLADKTKLSQINSIKFQNQSILIKVNVLNQDIGFIKKDTLIINIGNFSGEGEQRY